MATDGPDPPACDPEVYASGEVVLVTHTVRPNALEEWVRSVACRSGQQVDWHYVGGRAVVKALGDMDEVAAALRGLRPELDRLYQAEMATSYPDQFDPAERAPWLGGPG